MYSAVAAAWPPMCRRFEGVTTWMYLDTKGKVTTGVGFLIDTAAAAQALPWLTRHAAPATPEQVAAEWRRVKARTDWTRYSGLAAVWRDSAILHLTDATVTRLLATKTDEFWTRLGRTLPDLDTFPADAQLALLDLAWQNGPAFLDPGTAWVGTRAAVLKQDWAAAASHVPGTGARADTRKRLFANAAAVGTLKLDPAILWDTRIPTAPKEPDVAYSSQWRREYVWWRGGNFPLRTRDKLLAIPSTVRVTQGGLSFARASAKTHAGLGAFDLNTDGMTKDQVWQQCRELLAVGIIPFPRGFTWDSFQGRTIANTNDGNEHLHCIDVDEYDHLHPEAQAQVREWKAGGDGLVGSARYTGPSGGLGKWADSPWNPKNKEAAADAAREKELELPTTAEVAKALASDKDFLAAVANAVINADVIPNTFTSNAENLTVSTKTALTTLGKRSGETNAKLDALIARFPEQPPAPPA